MDTRTLKHRATRRTTLTLEADVADYIKEKLAANSNLKEKNVVNDLLRQGIEADESKPRRLPPFAIKPHQSALAEGMTVDRLEEMIREIG